MLISCCSSAATSFQVKSSTVISHSAVRDKYELCRLFKIQHQHCVLYTQIAAALQRPLQRQCSQGRLLQQMILSSQVKHMLDAESLAAIMVLARLPEQQQGQYSRHSHASCSWMMHFFFANIKSITFCPPMKMAVIGRIGENRFSKLHYRFR